MCVWSWWAAGEGLLQIQEEDIQSAFQVSQEGGSILICTNILGGINSLTYLLLLPSSPETQADGYDFGNATWTQRVVQNIPAAAQRCLERGGSYWLVQHIQGKQTKHCAAGWRKKYRWSPWTLVNDWCCQKTWQVGKVGWSNKGQFVTHLIYKKRSRLYYIKVRRIPAIYLFTEHTTEWIASVLVHIRLFHL